MNTDEVRFSTMCAISMALKSPKLQQGFEIICKNLSELEKENAELNDKLNNLASVAEVRLGMWQKYEKENAELKKESNQLFLEGAKRVEELEAQIEKMKCCGNCAKNGHICVAEEMQGKLCGKNKDKWELER